VNEKVDVRAIEPVDKPCEKFGGLMGQNEISKLNTAFRYVLVLHGVLISSSGKTDKQFF
jgi:hypothetical protein